MIHKYLIPLDKISAMRETSLFKHSEDELSELTSFGVAEDQ